MVVVSMRSSLRNGVCRGREEGFQPLCNLGVRWEEVYSLCNGPKACLSGLKSPWRR